MKSLVIMLALLLVLSVSADDFLTQLQTILNEQRGSWTAVRNNFTDMNTIERARMLSLLPNIPNVQPVIEVSREELPRATILQDTPIKDQASCGSCYSFGACAAYEGWKLNTAGTTLNLSEQYFMMKAKAIDGEGYGGCNGWYLDTSMDLLKNYGTCAETACTYKGYETACASSATGTYKIGSWSATTDLNTIKKAINEGKPVYVGFAVYSDFWNYDSGIYKYASGSLEGYHAVCIVGYDDANECFKVKNSWGTGWGENGYFRIAYSQMTNEIEFGTCFGGSFYINY